MTTITFKGEYINGDMDLDTVEMVCVPSHKYQEVQICLKDGWNFVIAEIEGNSLAYEEKKKLGYEIEKRWNAGRKSLLPKEGEA